MAKEKKLNIIKLWKAVNYRGCMIYIRQIRDIFEYLIVYDKQVFNSYVIIKLPKGKVKLTKGEKIKAAGVVFAGAVTTIDQLLDNPEKTRLNNIEPKEIKINKTEVKTLN